MKTLFSLVAMFIVIHSFSQTENEDNSIKEVGNTYNMELLKLPPEYKSVSQLKYVFIGEILDLFKFAIYDDEYEALYKNTGISREYFGSGLTFSIAGEKNIIYTFPINGAVFNQNYFNHVFDHNYFNRAHDGSILQNSKIYVTIYNIEGRSFPVVIVEKVALDE